MGFSLLTVRPLATVAFLTVPFLVVAVFLLEAALVVPYEADPAPSSTSMAEYWRLLAGLGGILGLNLTERLRRRRGGGGGRIVEKESKCHQEQVVTRSERDGGELRGTHEAVVVGSQLILTHREKRPYKNSIMSSLLTHHKSSLLRIIFRSLTMV